MKFAAGAIASISLLGLTAADSCETVETPTKQSTTPTEMVTDATLMSKNSSNFARFFDQDRFRAMFPDAVGLYHFDGLVAAANKYSEFANTGNDSNDKRELAAFLAQTAHGSDNFKAAEEYARDTYSVWQYCDNSTYPCAADRRYHGRGPMQLAWNYNYFNAGKDLGIDLLNNPDIVAQDTAVTWMTALWFWMTPQKNGQIIHDFVAGVNGFARSTDTINGGLECGPDAPNQVNEQQRIAYFIKMCDALDVQPLGNTSCNAQTD